MGTTEYDFEGETVVVTGSSSGIGRAVARRFGAAGATVVCADLDPEPKAPDQMTATHELIREAGGEAHFVETDVSDADEVTAVVEAAREFGGVDVMVNNAGIFLGDRLLDADPDDFRALFGVNAMGVFLGTRAAARDMLDRDDPGCIVNTASISSTVGQVGQSLYNATKGAVKLLTRNAALELAEADIRVNAVAPGAIDTQIGGTRDGDRERSAGERDYRADRERLEKAIPMGRSAKPEEIAGVYLALASEDASYVTGDLWFADGGYVAY